MRIAASSRSTGRRLEQNCMVMFWRNAILGCVFARAPCTRGRLLLFQAGDGFDDVGTRARGGRRRRTRQFRHYPKPARDTPGYATCRGRERWKAPSRRTSSISCISFAERLCGFAGNPFPHHRRRCASVVTLTVLCVIPGPEPTGPAFGRPDDRLREGARIP